MGDVLLPKRGPRFIIAADRGVALVLVEEFLGREGDSQCNVSYVFQS